MGSNLRQARTKAIAQLIAWQEIANETSDAKQTWDEFGAAAATTSAIALLTDEQKLALGQLLSNGADQSQIDIFFKQINPEIKEQMAAALQTALVSLLDLQQ